MDGLFRRGGLWWARLVVPARLRAAAGRREFVRSTRCHDLALAKIIGATLLTTWRRYLLQLDGDHMDDGALRRLLDGSPVLAATEFTTLARAGALTGLELDDLLREAAAGQLTLYCRVPSGSRAGWSAGRSTLESYGPGCWVVPSQPPADAMYMDMGGHVLRLLDGGSDVADAVLADGEAVTKPVVLVVLEHGSASIWAPDVNIALDPAALEVRAAQVESIRRRWAAGVSAARLDTLERAETARAAPAPAAGGVGGLWADKRFSEVVETYCSSPDGLLKELKSEKEAKQRKATMLRLVELHGDRALGEITTDDLRAFRDWLRTWPSNANRLGRLWRVTMTETIAAVAAAEPGWPKMSEGMVQERIAWLVRLFRWLKDRGHLATDVALPMRDDGDGLTKAERESLKAAKEAAAAGDDDEDGRVPFDAGALAALFGLPQFKTGHGRHVRGNARCYPNEYWLRLLCVWHGLRLSEGAQLWLSDVREVDGTMVLDINRHTPDKSLKNAQSKRLVPLHPELVRLGFLKWCDRLREAGFRRVFPELLWRDGDERYRREPGRKMTKDLKVLGYPRDSSLTFHSLRATFNNALARVKSSTLPYDMDEGMRTFLRYTLVGHAIEVSDANKKHYSRITRKEYAAIVAAVEFEGMPEVAPFDMEWGLEAVRTALSHHCRKVGDVEDCGPAT